MADSPQDFVFPLPRLPFLGELFQAHKAALALGMLGATLAATFISAHWSIALAGAVTVLLLSAMESERFLLLVIFLTPLEWVVVADIPAHNVTVNLRFLVIAGFFAGRVYRCPASLTDIFRPAASRASLLFLCAAAVAPIIMGKSLLTYHFVRAVYTLGTFVGFYFVVLTWVDSGQRIRKVSWTILFSTLTTVAFALLQQTIGGYTSLWLYLYPPDDNFEDWGGRSTSFLHHPNLLAGYLNLVLPFALACYLLGRGRWKKLGGWIFGLGSVALISTQSIGGLFAYFAILALAVFCFARSRKKKLLLMAGLCAVVCLSYILRNVLNPIHTEAYIGNDVITRLLLWVTAGDEFIHSPVFGVGWGNFAAPYDWEIPTLPGVFGPHNLYLQLLAETGLVGFVAFFYLFVQTWRQAWSQWCRSVDFLNLALAFGVLGALLSVLVHGFVDFPLDVQIGALLWTLLALFVASDQLQRKSVADRMRLSEG
jgi:putative inorganic carbon (hco3(-)) transporter